MDDLECAKSIMETIPAIMRRVKEGFHEQPPLGLTHPQFRVLVFLHHQGGANLSELSDHTGLTLPTMSKMVDGLVRKNLLTRSAAEGDRRRVVLKLTEAGEEAFMKVRTRVEARMAQRLSVLSPEDRQQVADAMTALRQALGPQSSRGRNSSSLDTHKG